jgi:antitoxin component of RelBE/YafQ-DinJ toxin-antitoxin module
MCITPSGPVPAGHDWFPTEEAANASMEETVKKHAKAWLDDCGIKIEDAVRMTVAHGDDAVKMTNKVAREINENLH